MPGTRIITDGWSSYKALGKNPNYTHASVNHSYNFVSPDDPTVHTQNIERMWRSVFKDANRKRHGTIRSMIDGYLCEGLWRLSLEKKDPFEEILSDISRYWPAGTKAQSLPFIEESV